MVLPSIRSLSSTARYLRRLPPHPLFPSSSTSFAPRLHHGFTSVTADMSATTPHRIVVTRQLPPQGQQLLDEAAASGRIELVQWGESENAASKEWVLQKLGEGATSGVLCMLGDKIDEETVAAAGASLEVVSTMSAGYDHVETAALAKRSIRLGTTPDALTDATADIGAMLVLMASRRAGEGIRAVADGLWPSMPWSPLLLCGHALQKSTVGVLGFGKIGQLTLKRLLGFGIGRALYTTSKPGESLAPSKDYFNLLSTSSIPITPAASLDELASQSDFLIICCALTPATTNLVDERFLSLMKPNAYIVNTARGPVVDSGALVDAVQKGVIAGAGLDVVTGEPNIGANHPLVKEQKIVVLPHIGSATLETRGEMARQSVINLFAGLEGGEWVNEVKV